MKLNKEQRAIIHHTINRAANGLYCGGSKDMDALVEAGLMRYVGKKAFCSDKFYQVTSEGRVAIEE